MTSSSSYNCSSAFRCACKDAADALVGCGDGASWTLADDDGGLGPAVDHCDAQIFPKKKGEWCTRPYYAACNENTDHKGKSCTEPICNSYSHGDCCEEDMAIWGGIAAGGVVFLASMITLCCCCCPCCPVAAKKNKRNGNPADKVSEGL